MSGTRSAAIVVVGDELLAGAHPDLNSPTLARELARIGITTDEVRVVPDVTTAIAAAITAMAKEHSLVFLSGGLGPTLDDVTRDGVAAAMGVELVECPKARGELERWFEGRGLEMQPINLRQAQLPAGALRVFNRVGTAPGFRGRVGGAEVISLPGPPRELRVVFTEEVVPWLIEAGFGKEPLGEQRFFLFGISESEFAERVGPWMDRDTDPRMGCSAKEGALYIVLRARGEDGPSLERLAERTTAFRERFSEFIFAEGTEGRLQHVLGLALIERGLEISLAESCTAGLATALLADVPGVSRVLKRAWVTYADEAKVSELGVPAGLIAEHGAVSVEVAEAMARGAAERSGAPLAVAVTGIAGPDGGGPGKPVGHVCFATVFEGEARTFARNFPPVDRKWIRAVAARTALHLALGRLRDRAPSRPPSPSV